METEAWVVVHSSRRRHKCVKCQLELVGIHLVENVFDGGGLTAVHGFQEFLFISDSSAK